MCSIRRSARFGFALRHDNDVQFWTYLLIVIAFGVAIWWFYAGLHEETQMSEHAQKIYNYYFHGKYQTDHELASLGEKAGSLWHWLLLSAWPWVKGVFLALVIGVIPFFFYAFHDNVMRVYRGVKRRGRERARSSVDLPDPGSKPERPSKSGGALSRLFHYLFSDVITELGFHWWSPTRRRR